MFQLNMDDFVALNALIAAALGVSILGGSLRTQKSRTRPLLNFDPKAKTQKQQNFPKDVTGASRQRLQEPYGAAALRKFEEDEKNERQRSGEPKIYVVQEVTADGPMELHAFFIWNGHMWDAHEVLGLQPGASRENVVKAFNLARGKSPDSTAFLQAAADAILKP